MESSSVERKLTTTLHADVHGYSRLMGADEVATLRTLTAYRELLLTLIRQHRGRAVGSAGDSLLAEFASVVEAVQCAVEIQRELKARNAELPSDRRMEFRLGINLGDVMVDGEQIYGDGVNIAARLESLAEPGGICIAGAVYEQVKNKLALRYEDLGEQRVKNIAEPVRVWRIRIEPEAAASTVGAGLALPEEGGAWPVEQPGRSSAPTWYRRRGVLALAGLLLIAGVLGTVRYLSFLSIRHQPSAISHQPEPTPALPLPDKPSIAVLPFANMSSDPEQEYFSDGLTDDLITDLSRLSGLFVIARNSVFTYKGKAVKVEEVSRELGVQYVLEGSVRKADNRVRINAQLVDATTGHHLWAEHYDRPLTDIFALQDEIRQKIVTTLKLQLTLSEQGIFVRRETDNLEAYDYCLRGVEYFNRFTQEANVQARQMFERAIELDPTYARAYAGVGWTYSMDWGVWGQDLQSLERTLEWAQKALALNDSLANAHVLLGWAYLFKKQHDQARAEFERSIALDPNEVFGYAYLALILNFAGRPAEAIGLIEKALRLDPRNRFFSLNVLGGAYRLMGRYEEAIVTLRRAINANPNYLPPHTLLAAIYSELGREEEARAEAAEVLRINPNFSLEVYRQRLPFKNQAESERYLAALRKAGLK
ncbi:MAG: adenylate/guanylate cyclase domain-containing protein [Deltaproteobacteria bacterium]|nr:adenylate/guanylate cyclase domain-containing protein [Deltaproteobacteria bacterium]